MQHPNIVEFMLSGTYALFSDPVMRVGGEKCTYQVPTYEALKGALASVYWRPTFIWVIDRVRIMNQIKTEVKGMRTLQYKEGKNDLSYYTYLKDVCYQVQAHFEWNMNRPEFEGDRNENKHHEIAKRMIERGGRRDVFLGARECQAYAEPCVFGEGKGYYDSTETMAFGLQYHGITYPDEATRAEDAGKMTINLWYPEMKQGVIEFLRPEDCPYHKQIQGNPKKVFPNAQNTAGEV